MRELIGSVMVSSLLLSAFGTLSLLLFFRLPSTFLSSKGGSITTLGTRWHDLFINFFFIIFFSFVIHFFPFPASFNLPFLKRQVYHHHRDQIAVHLFFSLLIFFPYVAIRYYALILVFFPASLNFPSFKGWVYHHLWDQKARFYSLFFINIF